MAEQDIREDQMTSVSSVDYVRGLKGKDSVLIKPGDLPSPNIKYIDNQLVTVSKVQMICKCKYKTI